MAVTFFDDRRLMRRAFGASLAVHGVLALLLPTWIHTQSQELQPVETLTFARIVRLDIARPPARAPERLVVKAVKRAPVPTFAHVKSEVAAHSKTKRSVPKPVAGTAGLVAAAPKAVPQETAAPLYARTSASAEPIAAASESAPMTPAPAAAVGAHSVNGADSDRGGVMPLGASQNPVLDPRVLATLQERIGVHVTLVVRVGEDGRTEHVAFDPPVDSQTEQTIEAILAQANWDAAICGGGVSCEGTATIRL